MRLITALFAVLLLLFLIPFQQVHAKPLVSAYAGIIDSLNDLAPDFNYQAEVDNLVLDRGGVKMSFYSGIITLSTPVMGRSIAASFSGKGRFTMKPTLQMEKLELQRHCRDTVADWPVEEAILVFADTTFDELTHRLQFKPHLKEAREKTMFLAFKKDIEHDFDGDFGTMILTFLRDYPLNGPFYMRFYDDRKNKMLFTYEPEACEPVNLRKRINLGDAYNLTVCNYAPEDTLPVSYVHCSPSSNCPIDSLRYAISVNIDEKMLSTYHIDLNFVTARPNLSVLWFYMSRDLIDTSLHIRDSSGNELSWSKDNKESRCYIFFDHKIAAGSPVKISFEYASKKIVKKDYESVPAILMTDNWYPQIGYSQCAKFDMTFVYPDNYTLISVGDKISEKTENHLTAANWSTGEKEYLAATFDLGEFYVDSVMTASKIPIYIYATKNEYKENGETFESLKDDLARSFNFFNKSLTKYPYSKLIVVEDASYFGEVYPGYLRLGFWTFLRKKALRYTILNLIYGRDMTEGDEERYRASMVAQQWFGDMVRSQTYHDVWINHGLTEYFASCYAIDKHSDDSLMSERFWESRDFWLNDIFNCEKTVTPHYTEYKTAPLILGDRMFGRMSIDLVRIESARCAYVINMIRTLMINSATNDESRFVSALRDYLTLHQGGEANTEDFRQSLEKFYKSDLGWLFDEYVYSKQLPMYRWKAISERQSDGSYTVNWNVVTENVPNGFRTAMPVAITMKNGTMKVFTLTLAKPAEAISLKVPAEPAEYIFNANKAILCTDEALK